MHYSSYVTKNAVKYSVFCEPELQLLKAFLIKNWRGIREPPSQTITFSAIFECMTKRELRRGFLAHTPWRSRFSFHLALLYVFIGSSLFQLLTPGTSRTLVRQASIAAVLVVTKGVVWRGRSTSADAFFARGLQSSLLPQGGARLRDSRSSSASLGAMSWYNP